DDRNLTSAPGATKAPTTAPAPSEAPNEPVEIAPPIAAPVFVKPKPFPVLRPIPPLNFMERPADTSAAGQRDQPSEAPSSPAVPAIAQTRDPQPLTRPPAAPRPAAPTPVVAPRA